MRFSIKTLSVVLGVVIVGGLLPTYFARAQTAGDELQRGFEAPAESAKPRVWWHWMNGNITKEGIKLDLEWMHRAGLGGFQNFDAALETPQVVKKRLIYMTPEWKDAFRYATAWGIGWDLNRRLRDRPAGANRAARGCRRAGHEEVRLERDAVWKAASGLPVCWPIRREHRSVSEHGHS